MYTLNAEGVEEGQIAIAMSTGTGATSMDTGAIVLTYETKDGKTATYPFNLVQGEEEKLEIKDPVNPRPEGSYNYTSNI